MEPRHDIIANKIANQLLMTIGTKTKIAVERVFYHGGLPSGSNKQTIEPFKESIKQNKPGRHYGGFYMTEDIGYAKNYVRQNENALFRITIDVDEERSLNVGSGIERINVDKLEELSHDYDLLYGKSITGKEEYVLLNPSIIKKFEEVKDEKDDKRSS